VLFLCFLEYLSAEPHVPDPVVRPHGLVGFDFISAFLFMFMFSPYFFYAALPVRAFYLCFPPLFFYRYHFGGGGGEAVGMGPDLLCLCTVASAFHFLGLR